MSTVTVRPTSRDLPEYLLSQGRHWITSAELAALLGIPKNHVSQRMAAALKQNRLFSPMKGAYVPIPPEYRSWGSPPATHFIDPLMRSLADNYYVALLSAAEMHGAAHQRPQATQVIADARISSREFGRVRIQALYSKDAGMRPTERRNTPTGTLEVSIPAVTAFDLVQRPNAAGGLSNVATVLAELVGEGLLAGQGLVEASSTFPKSISRRVGWIIDFVADDHDLTDDLASAVARGTPTTLMAGGPRRGPRNKRWGVLVNMDLEPDL